MSIQLIACINDSAEIFKGYDRVLLYTLSHANRNQKQVFFRFHDFETILAGCSSFFEDQCICTEADTLYLRNEYLRKNYSLTVYEDHLITNTLEDNPFLEYLMRYERCWCLIDEKQSVHWLGVLSKQ